MFSWTKRSKRSFHAENLKRQQKPLYCSGAWVVSHLHVPAGETGGSILRLAAGLSGETLALVRLDIRDTLRVNWTLLHWTFAEQIFVPFKERKKR